MNIRIVIPLVLLLTGAAWWLLYDDPETQVRNAHSELVSLLNKSGEESGSISILNTRLLLGLFANPVNVSGDVDELAGSYSPEEMVRTILSVQGLFQTIDLTVSELMIEFPSDDQAVVNFSAVLEGTSLIDADEAVIETREVVSRMLKVDGDWLYAAFRLSVSQNRD